MEFRLEHHNLTDGELVKKTFKIDQATLREIDGVSDLIKIYRSQHTLTATT
jgi:hypothetical protein